MGEAQIKAFFAENRNLMIPNVVLGIAFEQLYIDRSIGYTKHLLPIDLMELANIHPCFYKSEWHRSDKGYLGTRYNMVAIKEDQRIIAVDVQGKKATPPQLQPKYRKVDIERWNKIYAGIKKLASFQMAVIDATTEELEEILVEKIMVENSLIQALEE